MPKQKNIQIDVPADLVYSAMVREVASAFFELNRFNSIWCYRLKLAVDELFMNAVKYGSSADDMVYLRFKDEGDRIHFAIEDSGHGKNKMTADQLKQLVIKNTDNKDLTRTSGRGLSLIVQLWTDAMNIAKGQHGGIEISFSKIKEKTIQLIPPAPVRIAPAPSVTVTLPTADASGAPASTYTIALKGDINSFNLVEKSNAVQSAINSMAPHSQLILDFHDVAYINSLFIGHLAAWYNALTQKKGVLKIVRISPVVKDILDLVGLSKIVTIT